MNILINYKNPIRIIAFGFGIGLFPKAPGTLGTLVAIPFFWLLSQLSLPNYIGIVFLLTLLSIWICNITSQNLGIHDDQRIVLDEMVGYWITMTGFPAEVFWICAGFLCFRLFDIWKPWPISWIQKNIKGGVGIVLDDVFAGLFAWGILTIISYLKAV